MEIILKRTNNIDPDFQLLVRELDTDLLSRYHDQQDEYDKHNKIEPIDTVIVAYHNYEPVGCGCFKEFEKDTVEIKRMYVKSQYRGLKISRNVLQALEDWAKSMGFRRAVLETANKQPEAIGLYKTNGYTPIESYGPYKHFPASTCYEKLL